MAKRQTATAPWQELEQQAYHAYREWPVWLALRERLLSARGPSQRGHHGRTAPHPPGAAGVDESLEPKTPSKGGGE